MLIDIDPADIVGTIDVTMIFDDGTEVTVGAPVKPLDMAGEATWAANDRHHDGRLSGPGLSGSGPDRPARSVGVGSGRPGVIGWADR